MRGLTVKNIIGKILLVLFVVWGAASFFLFPTTPLTQWLIVLVSFVALWFIFFAIADYFPLFLIIFTNLYTLYGIQSIFGLPLWLIILLLLVISATTFYFLAENSFGEEDNFQLYLVFFSIGILELFLTLSFWLINPLTRSFLASVLVYIYYGALALISQNKKEVKFFRRYVYLAIIIITIVLLTVTWGH